MSRCLSGEYEHKLDAKGRLIMPLKLRAELGESFMVTKGIDKCLYVYSMDEWEQFVEKLNKLPMTNRTARTFKRRFLSGANRMDREESFSPLNRESTQRLIRMLLSSVMVRRLRSGARLTGTATRTLLMTRAWQSLQTSLMSLILVFKRRMVVEYGICTQVGLA